MMETCGIVITIVLTLGSIIFKNVEMFRRLIFTIEQVMALVDDN